MNANTNKSASTLDVLATDAANAYADAVLNNSGKGGAAVKTHDAIARAISDGLGKGDAAETVAVYMQAALAARGSRERFGANKATQLALAFGMAVDHGAKRTDVALIGAVYLARVGKVEGGADAIAAVLAASKGKPVAERVQAVESMPRAESKPKNVALTVEAVQKYMDGVTGAEWSDADRRALALILTTAAEVVATVTPAK